jgi:hypothetical protein
MNCRKVVTAVFGFGASKSRESQGSRLRDCELRSVKDSASYLRAPLTLTFLIFGATACHRMEVKPVHFVKALQAQEDAIAMRDQAAAHEEAVIANRTKMKELLVELEQVIELADRRLLLCEREVKEQGVLVPPRPMLPNERYRPITPALDR